jgi:hypothetical protein
LARFLVYSIKVSSSGEMLNLLEEFYHAKPVFLAVNVNSCWLNNISGVD